MRNRWYDYLFAGVLVFGTALVFILMIGSGLK